MTNLSNTTISVSVADDSHNHVISNIDGLQSALDSKADDSTTITAGTHLSGGGSLSANRTISLEPDTNTYIVDSEGNNRLYFGSSANSSQFRFRFSSTGLFEWRDNTGAVVATVDHQGNASFNNISSNGSSLTNINADNITSGTISDDRLPSTITSNITGNAGTATKLATPRSISLGGELSGSASFDGTSNITISGTVNNFAERVEDTVGAMVSGNTENGITVTYNDTTGTLNFDVNDPVITLTGDVSGSATMTNLSNTSINVTVADNSHAHTTSNITGLTEEIQDVVGGMVTSNTEDGIVVTYNDTTGTLNFDIDGTVIRNSGDQTINGSLTLSNRLQVNGHIRALLGTNGGYSTTTGSGSDWGSNIWGIGDAYTGSTPGSSYEIFNTYGISWLRAGHPSVSSNIGEGMYIYQNGVLQGGLGSAGIYSAGDIAWDNFASGNGSGITNINASNISTGTISDSRLPSTITSDITGTAANANLLDNLNSTQFLRSDTSDTMSGNLTVTGQVLAGSFDTNSALKYKKDVVGFNNALNKVMQIDTIYYTPKTGKQDRKIGVTAESLAKVAPEFVKFKNGEPDAVNYGQMTAMLIRAIQEQEERRLVNKIKKLANKVLSWFKR